MAAGSRRAVDDGGERAVLAAVMRGSMRSGVDGLVLHPTRRGRRLRIGPAARSFRPSGRGWRRMPLAVYDRPAGALFVHGGDARAAARLHGVVVDLLTRRFELDQVVEELLSSYEELNFLWDLQEALRGAVGTTDAAEVVLARVLAVMPCRGAALYALGAAGDGMVRLASAGVEFAPFSATDDDARVAGALAGRRAVALEAGGPSGRLLGARVHGSALLAPLVDEGRVSALLCLVDRRAVRGGRQVLAFRPGDRRLMETVAGHAATLLSNILLAGARQEVQCARRIQGALLPRAAPRVSGLDVAFACSMASIIGGDFVEFSKNPRRAGGTLRLTIGDVAGHDFGAALLMAVARTAFRGGHALDLEPAPLLRHAAAVLDEDLRRAERFLSVVCAAIPHGAGPAVVCNAGHPGVVRMDRRGQLSVHGASGTVLGVGARPTWRERRIPFEEGDTLLFLTDGITEAESPAGASFGDDALAAVLAGLCGRPAADVVAGVLSALEAFTTRATARDDVSLIAVRRVKSAAPGADKNPRRTSKTGPNP